MSAIENVSFLGLGIMGAPMAAHLMHKAGLNVTVYNRTYEKAQAWVVKNGGRRAETPAKAAKNADIIFCCVGNDDDVRSVLSGPDGVIQDARPGTIIVDHTTASAGVARDMAVLFADKQCGFLDAPVSGGQSGAERGQLTVMVGGDAASFEKVEPILRRAYAKEIRLMGSAGSGQLTKMVNQICIAGVLQGLSEGLNFGKAVGLNMEHVLAVISKGAAQSWQMDNRGPTMVQDKFDFGFAIDWMIKDLQITLEEAQSQGAALPLTSQVLAFYKILQERGEGRLDTSALVHQFRQ